MVEQIVRRFHTADPCAVFPKAISELLSQGYRVCTLLADHTYMDRHVLRVIVENSTTSTQEVRQVYDASMGGPLAEQVRTFNQQGYRVAAWTHVVLSNKQDSYTLYILEKG